MLGIIGMRVMYATFLFLLGLYILAYFIFLFQRLYVYYAPNADGEYSAVDYIASGARCQAMTFAEMYTPMSDLNDSSECLWSHRPCQRCRRRSFGGAVCSWTTVTHCSETPGLSASIMHVDKEPALQLNQSGF